MNSIRPLADNLTMEDAIRVLAYLKWNDAGRPDGRDEEFWLEAEKEFYEYYLPNYPNGLFPFLETGV